MAVSSFFAPIGEFFLLRRAEAAARGYSPAQRERVVAHRRAGDRRASAARRSGDPVSSAILFREALLCYARADDALGDAASRTDALALRLPPPPADTVEPAAAADAARVRSAVAASDPLYFDELEDEELGRVVAAFERTIPSARRLVETRSLLHIRATRIGRAAACLFLCAVAAFHLVDARLRPNVALGKPVAISSFFGGKPEALVDGDIGTSYAIATALEDNAWLGVDLQRPYRISEVDVFNRVDGWFDDALPLVLETSTDGVAWAVIARRDATFSASPPWRSRFDGTVARFVRIRSLTRTRLALSELAVYGR
jgi:hypothetical protein